MNVSKAKKLKVIDSKTDLLKRPEKELFKISLEAQWGCRFLSDFQNMVVRNRA